MTEGQRFCAWLALAAALLPLKSPDALITPQFWAEDGLVWFKDQLGRDWLPLHLAYSGYLHFWPRIAAWLAHVLPIAETPLIYALVAILIEAASIAIVTVRAGPIFGSVVVFVSFFVLPTDGELFGTITNAHWIGQVALVTTCVLPRVPSWPKGRGGKLALYAFLFSLSLSGPFSALIAAVTGGLFGVRWAARAFVGESRIAEAAESLWHDVNRVETWVVVCGAALQLGLLTAMPAQSFGDTLRFLMPDQLASLGLPTRSSLIVYLTYAPYTKANLLLALFLAGAVALAVVEIAGSSTTIPAGMALVIAVGLLEPLSAIVKYQHSPLLLTALTTVSRYYYVLGVASIWVCGKLLFTRLRRSRALVAALIAAGFVGFALAEPDLVVRPRLADLQWSRFAAQIEASRTPVLVPINPIGWAIEVGPVPHRVASDAAAAR